MDQDIDDLKREKVILHFSDPIIDRASKTQRKLSQSIAEVIGTLKKYKKESYLMYSYETKPEDLSNEILQKKVKNMDNILKFLSGLWGKRHAS